MSRSKRRKRGNTPDANKLRIDTQFVPHTLPMLESPGWRSLKINERRFLERLEIEHLRHGGRDNGKLAVAYTSFEQHGVRRRSIPAISRRLERLGLIEVTFRGRAHAELREVSQYRLTYLPTHTGLAFVEATHDWKRVEKKQNSRGDLYTEAGGDLYTDGGGSSGAICTLSSELSGAICTLSSRSRVDGRGAGGAGEKPSLLADVPSSAAGEAAPIVASPQIIPARLWAEKLPPSAKRVAA